MTIKLTDLLAPLEDMQLPNGRVVDVRPFEAEDHRTFREFLATNDVMLIPPLVKRALPDATEADLGTLNLEMAMAVLAHAQRKLDLVRPMLKNGPGGESLASTSPRSSTPMTKPVSARRSSRSGAAVPPSSSVSTSSPTT